MAKINKEESQRQEQRRPHAQKITLYTMMRHSGRRRLPKDELGP